uniref:Uncharacterized protein n=1 Tax=Siphoviridae sp. ctio73 TaxID=2826435 RepID=A0A8S5MXQ9_9CAUD|nr:MAG TPA: hypothetical protein [Siphoviridae sp. ctio73]
MTANTKGGREEQNRTQFHTPHTTALPHPQQTRQYTRQKKSGNNTREAGQREDREHHEDDGDNARQGTPHTPTHPAPQHGHHTNVRGTPIQNEGTSSHRREGHHRSTRPSFTMPPHHTMAPHHPLRPHPPPP